MDIHYYMSCYRSEALIASHLDPATFGRYMAVGTRKLTRGSYMFFEVDRRLASDYFRLHDIEQRCVPHRDGSPRSSKYISAYRVLEHLELAVLGTLYLVTADGRVLGLEAAPYGADREAPGANCYQEMCPVEPMVVTSLAPTAFGAFMTNPASPLWVPRLMFADLLLDRDDDGHLAGHLPYVEPLHIEDCLAELRDPEGKQTKTVSRNPIIDAFYRTIRRGFFVADRTGQKFYPFPAQATLEGEQAKWWRSAQAS